MYYIDPYYILLSLPALIIGSIAQILVRYYYSKYSRVGNSEQISGVETAGRIAREYDLNMKVQISLSELSDHYNPLNGVLTLSDDVARTPSIASVGITAHELGHVMQHKSGSILVSVRNFIIPIVNFGSTLGYIIFLIGLSFQLFGVVVIGIVLFSLTTLFTIITLPIEIDASLKAVKMIKRTGILQNYEMGGVKKVLTAASLTYVAAVMQSVSTLFYYILRAIGVRRKD